MYRVEVVRDGEQVQVTEYDPWPMETLPRRGDLMWTDSGRWRVREVIHAPYERRVTLTVTDAPAEDDAEDWTDPRIEYIHDQLDLPGEPPSLKELAAWAHEGEDATEQVEEILDQMERLRPDDGGRDE